MVSKIFMFFIRFDLFRLSLMSVTGSGNIVVGEGHTVEGVNNVITGSANTVYSSRSLIAGSGNVAGVSGDPRSASVLGGQVLWI